MEEEDPEAALEETFDRWRNERPEDVGFEESVRFGAAMAKMVFVSGGAITLTWVTFGDNCPYCNGLDGRVVGVQEFFLPAGLAFQPEGVATPLVPSSNIGHAPAHGGCDCMIRAGI